MIAKNRFVSLVFYTAIAAISGLATPQDPSPEKLDHVRSRYGAIPEVSGRGGLIATSPADMAAKSLGRFQKSGTWDSARTAWHGDLAETVPLNGKTLGSSALPLVTFEIPVFELGYALYAMRGTGEVVSVIFEGVAHINDQVVDAADAEFYLVDFATGEEWTVTGGDLGWSGQGNFGPTRSSVTHIFDGPLIQNLQFFSLWESANHSPWAGHLDIDATSSGYFYVTVRYPSPVALIAEYAAEGPDSDGFFTRRRAYSHSFVPNFEVDYIYEEELGYWEEQPGRQCDQGEINFTNFELGILNLTGDDVTACRFQASWDSQPNDCSQPIIDELNEHHLLLIRTEDYLYVPSNDCSVFTATDEHVMAGEDHWMWVEFVIGGKTYLRKMEFVKR